MPACRSCRSALRWRSRQRSLAGPDRCLWHRWVLLRDPQRRFEPQALLCTDLGRDPLQIVRWFIQRWQVEVTFREVRDHPGVETQRQWSDKAIARTTPCLLALFSLVTLLAAQPRSPRMLSCLDRRLVPQAASNLHRHARSRATTVLVRTGLVAGRVLHQGNKTPPGALPRHHLRALSRRLNGQRRAWLIVPNRSG